MKRASPADPRADHLAPMVFLALWVTFALRGFGDVLGVVSLSRIGGCTGLPAAAFAFYLAAATETHAHIVPPVGAPAIAHRSARAATLLETAALAP